MNDDNNDELAFFRGLAWAAALTLACFAVSAVLAELFEALGHA